MENQTEINRKAAIRAELHEKTTGYILTALGLVAGLAWNDAISSAIKYFFPLDTNGIAIKFLYAIIITLAIVIVSNSVMRAFGPKESK